MDRLILILLYSIVHILTIRYNKQKTNSIKKEYANQKVFIPEWSGGTLLGSMSAVFIISSFVYDSDHIPILYIGLLVYLVPLFNTLYVFTEEKLLTYKLFSGQKKEFDYKELTWKEESHSTGKGGKIKLVVFYKGEKKVTSINPNAFDCADQIYQFVRKIPMKR